MVFAKLEKIIRELRKTINEVLPNESEQGSKTASFPLKNQESTKLLSEPVNKLDKMMTTMFESTRKKILEENERLRERSRNSDIPFIPFSPEERMREAWRNVNLKEFMSIINPSQNTASNKPPIPPAPYDRIALDNWVVNKDLSGLQNNPYAQRLLQNIDKLVNHTKRMAAEFKYTNKPTDELPWSNIEGSLKYLPPPPERFGIPTRNTDYTPPPKHFSDEDIKKYLVREIQTMYAMGLLSNPEIIRNLERNGWTLEDLAAAGFLMRAYGQEKKKQVLDPFTPKGLEGPIYIDDSRLRYVREFPIPLDNLTALLLAREGINVRPEVEFYRYIYELNGNIGKDDTLKHFFKFYSDRFATAEEEKKRLNEKQQLQPQPQRIQLPKEQQIDLFKNLLQGLGPDNRGSGNLRPPQPQRIQLSEEQQGEYLFRKLLRELRGGSLGLEWQLLPDRAPAVYDYIMKNKDNRYIRTELGKALKGFYEGTVPNTFELDLNKFVNDDNYFYKNVQRIFQLRY
jgi:hypothetical protein